MYHVILHLLLNCINGIHQFSPNNLSIDPSIGLCTHLSIHPSTDPHIYLLTICNDTVYSSSICHSLQQTRISSLTPKSKPFWQAGYNNGRGDLAHTTCGRRTVNFLKRKEKQRKEIEQQRYWYY